MNLFSIFLNVIIIIMSFARVDLFTLRTLAALAVLLMWANAFYWTRLFEATAAFKRMLSEILSDITTFLIMLFICLTMFGNTFLILNQNRKMMGEDDIIGTYLEYDFADAEINQYLVGLGEF